jgi:hypothetical protein
MNSVFIPSPVPVALSLVQVVGITDTGSFIEGVSGSEFGIPVSEGARRLARNFGLFSPQVLLLPVRLRSSVFCPY